MRITPEGAREPPIQDLRAACGERAAVTRVARAPASTAARGEARPPRVMRVAQPAWRAIRAAMILVAMPPVPTPAEALAPPAMASMPASRSVTRGTWAAAGSDRGSAV